MSKNWVNADLLEMGADLRHQVTHVRDDEPMASERRAYLVTAAAHCDLAYAQLARLDAVLRLGRTMARAERALPPEPPMSPPGKPPGDN